MPSWGWHQMSESNQAEIHESPARSLVINTLFPRLLQLLPIDDAAIICQSFILGDDNTFASFHQSLECFTKAVPLYSIYHAP